MMFVYMSVHVNAIQIRLRDISEINNLFVILDIQENNGSSGDSPSRVLYGRAFSVYTGMARLPGLSQNRLDT